MTIRLSSGLRTMLVPFCTRPGYLTLYTEGQPPEVTSPPNGTALCAATPLLMEPAINGELKIVTSEPCVITAAGTVKWGRITPLDGADSTTGAVNDFTVGGFGSGADVLLSKVNFEVGDVAPLTLTIRYGGG